jgi:hypothetical protein
MSQQIVYTDADIIPSKSQTQSGIQAHSSSQLPPGVHLIPVSVQNPMN